LFGLPAGSLADLLFEPDWCEVAPRTVEPLVVVEDFDERDSSPADLGDRGPGVAVYQFLLESGEYSRHVREVHDKPTLSDMPTSDAVDLNLAYRNLAA
jgi:hypothetical protein